MLTTIISHSVATSPIDCWTGPFRRDFCCANPVEGCFDDKLTFRFCCFPRDPKSYERELLNRISTWWSSALGRPLLAFSSYARTELPDILALVGDRIPRDEKYVVNVGGACYESRETLCVEMDPALLVLQEHRWGGAIVDPQDHPGLKKWVKDYDGVNFKHLALVPQNALELMHAWRVPSKFAYLKIDIDSDDCDLLEVILSKYSPAVITLEVQQEMIPPILWSVSMPNPSQRESLYPYLPHGCSAEYAHRLVSARYELLQYDMVRTTSDLTWIRNDLMQPHWASVQDAFVAGYMEHQRLQTHNPSPPPFRERSAAWAEVTFLQLVEATKDKGHLRELLDAIRHSIQGELAQRGIEHLKLTLAVPEN